MAESETASQQLLYRPEFSPLSYTSQGDVGKGWGSGTGMGRSQHRYITEQVTTVGGSGVPTPQDDLPGGSEGVFLHQFS